MERKPQLDKTSPRKDDLVVWEVGNGTETPSGILGFGDVTYIHGPSVVVEWTDIASITHKQIQPRGNVRVILTAKEREITI